MKKITLPLVLYTKWKKISLFGLTFGHKRSSDSVMGGPIFANLVSKYARGFKEKTHEIARREVQRFSVHGEICLGGASEAPPPSAVRVKPWRWPIQRFTEPLKLLRFNYFKHWRSWRPWRPFFAWNVESRGITQSIPSALSFMWVHAGTRLRPLPGVQWRSPPNSLDI